MRNSKFKILNSLLILLIFLIIFAWLFSGWPAIWQEPRIPPEIQKAEAAINQTTYLSSTASTKITSTVSWQIVATAPGGSNITTSCKNAKTTGYCQEKPGVANATNAQPAPTAPTGLGWIYDTTLDSTVPAGTWTFNVVTGESSATGVGYVAVCAWKAKVSAGAITTSTAIFPCTNGTINVQATTTAINSSTTVSGVATTSFSNTEYLYVEYWLHTVTAGTGATAKMIFTIASSNNIVLPAASTNLAPNAPSQDSPANGATGVSVTPTFLMTATDPESDNLQYKVSIYSNSGCSTVVQTNDQSVSQAGWSGQNATTTNPGDSYLSGTQGNFTVQTALNASTTYYWRASAKDPAGSNTFTNSTTCNNFTTVAATVSCSTNITSTAFGTLSTASISTASPNASTTMSCSNTSAGCTLYVKDAGSGSNPGLWKSVSPTYLISSADATLSAGADGYGIQATSTAAGSGGTLTFNSKYNKIGNNVGSLSLTTVALASSTVDVSGREAVVTHEAAVSSQALSGSYSDTITYECVVN